MLDEPVDLELSEHQRIFADLIEDVLAAAPGLVYHRVENPHRVGRNGSPPFVIFDLETDPRLRLAVSIELADEAFTVRLNGVPFTRRLGAATRYAWWVERRCRDVERMLGSHLRIVHERFILLNASSTLFAGRSGRWWKLGRIEYSFVRVLPHLVPYGFISFHHSEKLYKDWYVRFDGEPGGSPI